MLTTLALVWLGLMSSLTRIDGTSACPRPDQVQAELEQLMADAPVVATPPSLRVTLSLVQRDPGTVGQLELELHDAAGRTLATRRLPPSRHCAELARAAAVVISSWLSRSPSGINLTLPAAAVTAPLDRSAPTLLVDRARPSSGGRGLTFDVGASFVALLSDKGVAPGGMLEAALGPRQSPWAARFAVSGTAFNEEAIAGGHGEWSHLAFGFGPRYRSRSGLFTLDLHTSFVAGLLIVEGRDLMRSQLHYGFDPGLAAGARLSFRAYAGAPFVGLNLTGWLRSQELNVANVAQTISLPRVEVLLSAGVLLGSR